MSLLEEALRKETVEVTERAVNGARIAHKSEGTALTKRNRKVKEYAQEILDYLTENNIVLPKDLQEKLVWIAKRNYGFACRLFGYPYPVGKSTISLENVFLKTGLGVYEIRQYVKTWNKQHPELRLELSEEERLITLYNE